MMPRDLRVAPDDLAALNERVITAGRKKSARRRLKHARKNFRRAQGRGARTRLFAGRELVCALAEAQEWDVVGGEA